VKLRLGENWDPAGGYVYRFTRREVYKTFSSIQTISRWRIFTTWLPPGSDAVRQAPGAMRFVAPSAGHGITSRVVTSALGRHVLTWVFRAVHVLIGRWGNSLIIVAWKKA
jgi:hypothetical protein